MLIACRASRNGRSMRRVGASTKICTAFGYAMRGSRTRARAGAGCSAVAGVNDAKTWPTQLQQWTGWNVSNAGEGAYQADQVVLLGRAIVATCSPAGVSGRLDTRRHNRD